MFISNLQCVAALYVRVCRVMNEKKIFKNKAESPRIKLIKSSTLVDSVDRVVNNKRNSVTEDTVVISIMTLMRLCRKLSVQEEKNPTQAGKRWLTWREMKH